MPTDKKDYSVMVRVGVGVRVAKAKSVGHVVEHEVLGQDDKVSLVLKE